MTCKQLRTLHLICFQLIMLVMNRKMCEAPELTWKHSPEQQLHFDKQNQIPPLPVHGVVHFVSFSFATHPVFL